MIYSVGCDIIEVARIKKSAESESFMCRAFSAEEIERFSLTPHPAQSMAGAWAAKEAFAKSLKTGVRGFSLDEITIAHDELGAPYFKLSGNAKKAAEGLELHLSISHTKEYAQAFCIACRKEM
ncbi:MAG: holo-ACP synthase [Ruminococcus sp.]|nr:holo-ACP synthase [Ruminococcus sp.]